MPWLLSLWLTHMETEDRRASKPMGQTDMDSQFVEVESLMRSAFKIR